MSSLLTQDAAKILLAPHLGDLARSMRDAVERYNAQRAMLGPLSPRTRACVINDYASENAERALDGRPGVMLVRTDDDTLIMIFSNRAIVRIKKLNSDLKISYIPTTQAKSWAAQQPLEGFPEATNLVAGYTLNELGDVDRVLLVCSRYGHRLWAYDLEDDGGAGALLDFPNDEPVPGLAVVRSTEEAEAEEAEPERNDAQEDADAADAGT